MDLNPLDHATPAVTEPEGKTAIMDLLDVMSEMKDVLIAENDLLDLGLPSALSDLTDIKTQLAEEFQDLSSDVLGGHAATIAGDPELGHRLIEAGMELRTLTQANMERLASAIAASQRRIEAVMMAIHDTDQENRTYAKAPKKGLTIGANYIEYSVNYKI
jgi:hypothetical protein